MWFFEVVSQSVAGSFGCQGCWVLQMVVGHLILLLVAGWLVSHWAIRLLGD